MKHKTKLVAAVFLLVTALVMVITTSFAWMTISDAPVVQGIQVTIAGSHTVLVAPDIAVTQGNWALHYPGAFSDELNFSEYSQYDYLKQTAGLLPVSTADGENWYIPTYYENNSPEVLNGKAYTGQLRPTTEFIHDNTLQYANMTPEELRQSPDGSYVYLDFWVVAPANGYKLRVSTGADGAGSFVIDLPDPQQTETENGTVYELSGSNAQTAATVRIGFLINEDILTDDSMLLYTQSENYSSQYRQLQGIYADPGIGAMEFPTTRFGIYEPNGDLHPTKVYDARGNAVEDGQYALTEPLGKGGIATDVQDRVSVQLANRWTAAGTESLIEQQFRTFMAGRTTAGETDQSLKIEFFQNWLQYQIYPYVTTGNFLSSTEDLYTIAAQDSIATSDEIAALNQAGATDDVYLTQLTANVPQRIRMYIWLEGQDVDCINSAAAGSFAISIELAGGNET